MDRNRIIAVGALLLATAVALGAFGAHGLKSRLATEQMASWRTAVEYHFYHGLGLLLIGLMEARLGKRPTRWAARLLVAGVVLFCGSLYLLSTKDLLGMPSMGAALGPITPFGGLCFIVGWGVLFITALRQHDRG